MGEGGAHGSKYPEFSERTFNSVGIAKRSEKRSDLHDNVGAAAESHDSQVIHSAQLQQKCSPAAADDHAPEPVRQRADGRGGAFDARWHDFGHHQPRHGAATD